MSGSPGAHEPSKALRVLIVEDDEDDVVLVVSELRRGGYDVTWKRVDTAPALEAALAEGGWDLVISDHNLPQFCAPDALHVVRQRAGDLPFIIVSGSLGEEQAVAVMRAGANDYLLKGQLARLTPAVERELAEAAQRRGREAAERALRQAEEQLRQAQKMEAIGRLAGGIAHDFNNLLTAILGYCELVLEAMPGDAPGRADLEEIRNAGQRAGSLTRQLLAFSRQQVLQPRVIDLNDTISNVAKLLRRVIGEDIELRLELDPELRSVRVDPGQIEQVLMNLAVNARDAMPGGGRLSIRSRMQHLAEPLQFQDLVLPPGPYVQVTVTDTGTGIPPEIVQRIFEPFFTTKAPGKGTGLGLSTVYGIVRQSGGGLTLDTALGRGTEVGIYLPCAEAPPEDDHPGIEAPASINGSESVLVVDDEAGIRTLVRRALEPLGYRVLSAANGEEAVGVAADPDTHIDLLITDVVMPKMGGLELVQRLSELRRGLPVLYLSGYPDATRMDEVIPRGSAFLMKPFTPATLTRTVRDLLNQAPARREGARGA